MAYSLQDTSSRHEIGMVTGQELERPGPHRIFCSEQAPQDPSSRRHDRPPWIVTEMTPSCDRPKTREAEGCPGKQILPGVAGLLAQFLKTGQCLWQRGSLWNPSASLTRPPEANDRPVGSGATSRLGWFLLSSARHQRPRRGVEEKTSFTLLSSTTGKTRSIAQAAMETKDNTWCWLGLAWPAGYGHARKQVCVNSQPLFHPALRRKCGGPVHDFSKHHHQPPRRRATRDRGSAVGDGVIPALLFD